MNRYKPIQEPVYASFFVSDCPLLFVCVQAKCWTERESWHVGKSNRKIKRGKARNNVLKCPFQTFACYWGSWLGSISIERMVSHAYAYVFIQVRCFRMAKKHADNSDLKD